MQTSSRGTDMYHISCKAEERKEESSRDNGANLEKRKTKIIICKTTWRYLDLNKQIKRHFFFFSIDPTSPFLPIPEAAHHLCVLNVASAAF